MSAFCKTNQIAYVDTLEAFRQEVKQRGRWLHFHKDAHPTSEGQALIADVVVKSALIQPHQVQ